MKKGKVYIIGAGPGEFKLLTLKAVECIKKADVIIYDRLINNKILSLAKQGAEFVYVGKMPDFHAVHQGGINEILVEKALEGKNVARIKGGDPFVFGRGGEEAEVLKDAGVDFEIIPGITASISVPAYAGIPVTHREYCSSFHVITGHEDPAKEAESLDYGLLAALNGTLVFMMGVKNLEAICSNLIKYGMDSGTPVALIENGTTREQRTVTGTLSDITAIVRQEGIKSPAVIVVGKVVELHNRLKWFLNGTLAGKRILVTRAREQASILVEKLEELGGETVEFPTIRIQYPEDFSQFDRALDNISKFSWLVFTSPNGVEKFFERMKNRRIDIRRLGSSKIGAIGRVTCEAVEKYGLNVDFVPEKFYTPELLEGLKKLVKPGENVLLARADIANPELSAGLIKAGIKVDDICVYRTVMDETGKDEAINDLLAGRIDIITFTSSSTVDNFVNIIGSDNIEKLDYPQIVCIGPLTAKTARGKGFMKISMAGEYTIDGLVAKVVELV